MFHVHLPLAHVAVPVPGVLLLGLLVGFLTGLFGVGGGFLMTPVLRIVFGVPYPIAVGSGLVQILITAAAAAYRHWRARHVDVKMGVVLGIGALLGTHIGKRGLDLLEVRVGWLSIADRVVSLVDLVLNLLFLLLMVAVVVSILRETSTPAEANGKERPSVLSRWLRTFEVPPIVTFRHGHERSYSVWVLLAISTVVGILTGLMGVGGGFVMFPFLVYLLAVPTATAVGTGALQVLFASGFGSILHFRAGHVEPRLVALLLAGALLGVEAGVALSRRVDARRLRKSFAGVLLLGILLIAWSLARMFRG